MTKKIISSLAVLSVVSSVFVSAVSANTFTLKDATDLATETTTRTVEVYYPAELDSDDYCGISGAKLCFSFDPSVGITAVANEYGNVTSDSADSLATPTITKALANGTFEVDITTEAGEGVYTEGNLLCTLTLTVPENTPSFELTLDQSRGSLATSLTDGNLDNHYLDSDIVLTVAGAKTEPDTVPFVSEKAEYLGRYDTDKTSVPVDAWAATIDWSKYDAVKALTWTLSVKGEPESVAAATQTEITGEMTVIYGLAIAGQAEAELNTIDKDNVVLK